MTDGIPAFCTLLLLSESSSLITTDSSLANQYILALFPNTVRCISFYLLCSYFPLCCTKDFLNF